MTGQPLRFVLPIRTSKRKAEAKSPQQQIDLATAWKRAHGHEIVKVLDSGKDESGKTMDRESIHEAMRMVRDGEADGILFAITDRLGRAPIEETMAWIRQLNLIGYLGLADAGGEPVRLSGKDPSRETMLVIQLQFARQYWLNTAARFRQSQRDAVKAGKWIGRTPLGYEKTGPDEEAALRPDPVTGHIITEAYRLAAQVGLHAAVDYLQAMVPTRQWTTDHVRRVLRNRAYLGEYRFELKDDPGNFEAETLVGPDHDELTDLATFTAAQTDPHTRASNGDYPLTHRVHCERCGAGLVGGSKTTPSYRRDPDDWTKFVVDPSKPKRTHRRMACSGGCANSISADKLEAHIREKVKARMANRAFRDTFSPAGHAEAEAAMLAAKANRTALPQRVSFSDPDFPAWKQAADAAVREAETAFNRLAGRSKQSERWPGPDELDKPEQYARALRIVTSRFVILVAPGRGTMTERVDFEPLDHDDVAGALAA